MIREIKWTPDSLKEKEVEIFVISIIVKERNGNFVLRMCETAEFIIFTIFQIIWVECTELGLEFFWPKKLFNSIVGHFAAFAVWASRPFDNVVA